MNRNSSMRNPNGRRPAALKIATRRASEIPRCLAIHEAGHAVASWAMQKQIPRLESWYPFDRIVVRSTEESKAGPYIDGRGRAQNCTGMLEKSDRYRPHGPELLKQFADQHPDVLEMARIGMEADVIGSLAGPIAEARFMHVSPVAIYLTVGSEDRTIAQKKAGDFTKDPAELRTMMTGLERRAAGVVRQYWPAILALADALLERRTLSDEEAVPIIEGAMSLKNDIDLANGTTAGRKRRP